MRGFPGKSSEASKEDHPLAGVVFFCFRSARCDHWPNFLSPIMPQATPADRRQLEIALMVIRDLEDYLLITPDERANAFIRRAKTLLEEARAEVTEAVESLSTNE